MRGNKYTFRDFFGSHYSAAAIILFATLLLLFGVGAGISYIELQTLLSDALAIGTISTQSAQQRIVGSLHIAALLIAALIFVLIASVISLRIKSQRLAQRENLFLAGVEQRQAAADDALKNAREEATIASNSKAKFLAVMSHEMRTPLNGVIGALDLLSDSVLDQDQFKLVVTAQRAGEELLNHIGDVLDYSKMESGKLEIDLRPFNITEMLTSVVDVLQNYQPHNGNRLELSIASDVAKIVVGDAQRIRQVLFNLGANAVKFTRSGTVHIVVAAVSETLIRFEVTDTGIGIAEDQIPLLFKEFSMLDSSLRRNSGGTGLGLAISAQLVEAMGGQIGVTSEADKGSTFWFALDLPAGQSDLTNLSQHTVPPEGSSSLNVLLVEDNRTNQFVAQKMLERIGCNVEIADNGQVALWCLEQDDFDIVLMDVSMPVMDGIEAVGRIRQMKNAMHSIPVIAMTANAIAGDRERFIAAGFTGYLSKPVRQADLRVVLAVFERDLGASNVTESKIMNIDIALVDREAIQQLIADIGFETMAVVFESFQTDVERQLARIETACVGGNNSEVKKAAHAISGLAATMGACRLASVAMTMEMTALSQSPQELMQIAHELRAIFIESIAKMILEVVTPEALPQHLAVA